MNGNDRHEFPTGAVRGTDRTGLRYDLLPFVGLRRLAATCAEGDQKYGAHNWRQGFPTGDVLNHALAHIADYLDGDRSEDHLAHAAWNLFVAMEQEERRPHLSAGLLGPGGALTAAIRADLDRRQAERDAAAAEASWVRMQAYLEANAREANAATFPHPDTIDRGADPISASADEGDAPAPLGYSWTDTDRAAWESYFTRHDHPAPAPEKPPGSLYESMLADLLELARQAEPALACVDRHLRNGGMVQCQKCGEAVPAADLAAVARFIAIHDARHKFGSGPIAWCHRRRRGEAAD